MSILVTTSSVVCFTLYLTFVDADVHSVSPKFHRAFDANQWLLLPETRIIDAYYDARNTNFLNINVCHLFYYSVRTAWLTY